MSSSDLPVHIFDSRRNAGQRTAYRLYAGPSTSSKATPLVLVQGMSAVGTVDWHDLASVLQRDRTVVTLDNRDMGQSSWNPASSSSSPAGSAPPAFTSLEELAQDVVDLVCHLGFNEIDICGHSMGGMIVQTLLCMPDKPVKIRHAILGATSARAPRSDLGTAVAREMRKASSSNAKDTRTKAEKDRHLTEIFMKYCYDPDWIAANPELYERRIQESLGSRRPAKTVALQQRAIGRYDVRDALPHLPSSLPVLVIHGSRDLAVYPDAEDEILGAIRHAKLAPCPRTDFGHNWYDYFGLEFWRDTIGTFLDGQPSEQAKSRL